MVANQSGTATSAAWDVVTLPFLARAVTVENRSASVDLWIKFRAGDVAYRRLLPGAQMQIGDTVIDQILLRAASGTADWDMTVVS